MTPDTATSEPESPAPICLVTGGSGFLGINLVRRLLGRGWRLRTLDLLPFDYAERDRIAPLVGDIRDAAAVEAAMQDVSSVVHCAAALPLAPAADILSTAVDGTRILLDAARRHAVSRFVFISSTAVYGVPDCHPITESHRLKGVGPYGESKIEAEHLCEQARRQGLCVSILRPKSFVGPERLGVFELLYDWAATGHGFPVLGRGDNLYQLLDVRDLCAVIDRCLVLERSRVDDCFNVGASQFGTMRDNMQCVLDRAGQGRHVVGLPVAASVLALKLLDALGLSPLYPWIYETAAEDSEVSIERLETRLGYTPTHSNRDALIANFDWYLAHRAEFAGRTGVTHRVPWKKGVLGWAKHLF